MSHGADRFQLSKQSSFEQLLFNMGSNDSLLADLTEDPVGSLSFLDEKPGVPLFNTGLSFTEYSDKAPTDMPSARFKRQYSKELDLDRASKKYAPLLYFPQFLIYPPDPILLVYCHLPVAH